MRQHLSLKKKPDRDKRKAKQSGDDVLDSDYVSIYYLLFAMTS